MSNNWTREELILAFNLYCKMPFSKINYHHKQVIELAEILGRTPSAVSWKLVNFASLDPSLKEKNISGAKNCSKLDKEIFNEFYNDWNSLVYESEKLLSEKKHIENFSEMQKEELDDFTFGAGKEKTALVKVRLNQSFFRQSILASYENKCCITGIEISDLLVASHIIPWKIDDKNRLNPENGLCLNCLHDKAFDRGLLTLDMDYKIILSPLLKKVVKDEAMQKFFFEYENKQITLPNRFLPNKEFLTFHRNKIFKGV